MNNMPNMLKELLMLALLKKLVGQIDGPEIEIKKINSFEDFKNMMTSLPEQEREELMEKMKEQMSTQRDSTEKKIGDTVILNDIKLVHYLVDFETNKQIVVGDKSPTAEQYEIGGKEAIVVGRDDNYTYLCGHCEHPHGANLIIYYPHNKIKYRINDFDTHLVPKN